MRLATEKELRALHYEIMDVLYTAGLVEDRRPVMVYEQEEGVLEARERDIVDVLITSSVQVHLAISDVYGCQRISAVFPMHGFDAAATQNFNTMVSENVTVIWRPQNVHAILPVDFDLRYLDQINERVRAFHTAINSEVGNMEYFTEEIPDSIQCAAELREAACRYADLIMVEPITQLPLVSAYNCDNESEVGMTWIVDDRTIMVQLYCAPDDDFVQASMEVHNNDGVITSTLPASPDSLMLIAQVSKATCEGDTN